MSADMNVIFRGNGKRKAEKEREQEEAAPAEEVFSSQATRCAEGERGGERQIDRRRSERDEGRGSAKEAAAAARFREREHSRSQSWERKERKAMESKSATSFSSKAPLLCLPFALLQIA